MNFIESLPMLLLFFLYGICIGSFLNVVIYRLPEKMPIAHGRSMCTKCGHTLHAIDLVPLFSYLFLRGKCRYCGAPIAARYPLVESLTGVLFALCGWRFNFGWYSILLCVYCCVLVIAWFIDLDHTYIPDRVHVVIVLLAALSWFFSLGPTVSLGSRLIGCVGVGGVMLLITVITGGGIGGGDIKLMAASGLLLGWPCMVFSFFLAYILAGLRYLVPCLKKSLPAHAEIPMAPYFSIALIIAALFGTQLINAYLALL